MEEDQPPPKQLYVTEATITFADGTTFYASPKVLKRLNKRVKQMGKIPMPILDNAMPTWDCSIMWIEE